ncbi:MAG: CaiB/BaiF CoA transferase family protein [Acidimicrobiales bacterium]
MSAVMEGVRVLEVAEHTFVPAASALLSDWGAEVIKIEHVERGDAMRGLASTGIAVVPNDVHVLLEHSNRGKKSLALDLTTEDGLAILHKLIATSDVFLTNKLPGVRTKLHIALDEVRAHNPSIIYVRGTGQGERGPDADKGSYDSLAFWARSGVAAGAQRPEYDLVPPPPAPGFGDSIGAMTIAGGIMGALFHRERTGEAATVDVSLLGVGMWAMGQALALSLVLDQPWAPPPADAMGSNPLSRTYQTADGRTLWFTCLQGAKYWPLLCESVGRPDLAADPRFTDHASLMANSREAVAELDKVFAGATLAEWRERLADFSGQWAVQQNTLEAAADPQAIANGYVQDCETASGAPFKLAAAPVQFDGQPPVPGRAPTLNEHGDAILEELGYDWDTIVDLKVRGVVA